MAKAWVCPECGQRNALDASECTSCGRWPSLFDLERTVEIGEQTDLGDDEDWEPVDDQVPPAPEPEPATEPMTATGDPDPDVTTTTEPAPRPTPEPQQRSKFPRWVIPVAVAAFVAIRALLENV